MYLLLEIVEHSDAVTARYERVDEMRADVSGAAGHEDVSNWHAWLGPLGKYGDESHADIGRSQSRAILWCVTLVLIGKKFERMTCLRKRHAM